MIPVAVILDLLVKYGPDVAIAAQKLLTTENPTQADWDALFDKAKKSFESYMAVPVPMGPPGG